MIDTTAIKNLHWWLNVAFQVNSDCPRMGGIFSTVDTNQWVEGIIVACRTTNNGRIMIRWVNSGYDPCQKGPFKMCTYSSSDKFSSCAGVVLVLNWFIFKRPCASYDAKSDPSLTFCRISLLLDFIVSLSNIWGAFFWPSDQGCHKCVYIFKVTSFRYIRFHLCH